MSHLRRSPLWLGAAAAAGALAYGRYRHELGVESERVAHGSSLVAFLRRVAQEKLR